MEDKIYNPLAVNLIKSFFYYRLIIFEIKLQKGGGNEKKKNIKPKLIL